jgi:hypothetical protein
VELVPVPWLCLSLEELDPWGFHPPTGVRLPGGVQGLRANVFTGGAGRRGGTRRRHKWKMDSCFVTVETRESGKGPPWAVAWHPGVVERPTPVDRILGFLRPNRLLLFPFVTLLGMWET